MLAEGDAPAIDAGVEVDCAQRAPRWLHDGEPGRVPLPPAFVSDELVGRRPLEVGGGHPARSGRRVTSEERDHGTKVGWRQIRRGHEAAAARDHLLELSGGATRPDLDE